MDESRLWYLGDYETPPPHEAFRPVTLRELADEFSAIEKAGSSEDEVAAARRALVLGSLGQPVYAATQDRRRFYAAGSGPVPQDGLDALAALADARPEAR
ncbi:MAG: hypothetical protein HY321_12415, partial [Armatimonadetes bacterium]|nr:hypothetical protein [Armatimonadota bacterium]